MMTFEKSMQKKGYCVVELTPEVMRYQTNDSKYNAIALCDSGEAVMEANMQKVCITKGMRMLVSHVMYTNTVSVSPDFHAWILVVSDEFSRDVAVGIPTEMLEAIFRAPTRVITNEMEWKLLTNFMENIKLYDQIEGANHSMAMAGSIFRCMLITMAEMEMQQNHQGYTTTYTMADTYFREFVAQIDKDVMKEHEVSYYAERLNITPKYLSEICKQKSGHKAKEIISSILIAKIKHDILVTGKSMKVIAYDYCFADQSSLGKFFRKMTGQSPSQFKRANGLSAEEGE